MSEIILLAFGSALYPILLAAVIVMLAAPRPLPLLGAYLAGGVITTVALGIAILYALDRSGAVSGSNEKTTSPVVDIVVGTLAVAVAWAMATGRDQRVRDRRKRRAAGSPSREPSWSQRVIAGGSVRKVFLAGMVLSLPSFYYLAALKDIAAGDYSSAEALGLILVFTVIQFVLIEAPLVGYIVAPSRTRVAVDAFNNWFNTHLRQIAEVAAAGIGIYLIVRGILDLA